MNFLCTGGPLQKNGFFNLPPNGQSRAKLQKAIASARGDQSIGIKIVALSPK